MFGPFLHSEFHQRMVTSNMHFGYEMLMDLLGIGKVTAKSILEKILSQFFHF